MMENQVRWIARLLLAGVLAGGLSSVLPAAESGCAEPVNTPLAGDALKAYIDPDTGELVSGPPPGQAAPPEAPGSAAPEPDYPSETRPDGTVELDLSGRPPEELRAETVDGKTVVCHGSESPPAKPD